MKAPGGWMYREIHEAPAVFERLWERAGPTLLLLATRWRRNPPDLVIFVGRGSSGNAALYGRYLCEVHLEVPASLAAPSVVTVYAARPRFRGAWVVALSQSGRSPDVVRFVAAARARGAFTLAVTNHEDSPLGRAAHEVLGLCARPERSVAATKTYLAQLSALSLFVAEAAGDLALMRAHASLPDRLRAALETEEAAAGLAGRWAQAETCIVAGRGYNYATAREAALKLKEAAYVAAEALSSADLLHGPVALLGRGFPVLVVAAPDRPSRHLSGMIRKLRRQGVELAVLSSDPRVLRTAAHPLPAPAGVPEELTLHVYVVSVQLLAYHMGLLRGVDPDRPRGLRKVTRTL